MNRRRRPKTCRSLLEALLTAATICLLAACATGAPRGSDPLGALEGSDPIHALMGSDPDDSPADHNLDAPQALQEIGFGWFESRFAAGRTTELAREGCAIAVPYVGRNGDTAAVSGYLDAADRAGLGVALQVPGDFVRSGDLESIHTWVEKFKDHPALLLWYLFDEPDVHKVPPENLEAAARLLRAEGGGRPLAVTFYDPRKAHTRYNGSFDLLWLNYYPFHEWMPDYFGIAMSAFSRRVEAGRKAAHDTGTKFGMILQAFGRSDTGAPQFNRRLPSTDELGFMLWTSLAASPSHLLFWSRYRTGTVWYNNVFIPTFLPVAELLDGGIAVQYPEGIRLAPAGKARLFGFRTLRGRYLVLINGSRRLDRARLSISGGMGAELLMRSSGAEADGTGDPDVMVSLPAYGFMVFRLE